MVREMFVSRVRRQEGLRGSRFAGTPLFYIPSGSVGDGRPAADLSAPLRTLLHLFERF